MWDNYFVMFKKEELFVIDVYRSECCEKEKNDL